MHDLLTPLLQVIASLGYFGVFFGMLLESTFLPVPSEIIMIPAAYLASKGEMSLILIFLFGTFGALIGASINYFLGKYLGAPLIHKLIRKYGKYFLISEKHYHQSEVFFKKHGNIATFTGRLLPGVRHLISIPAGIFHMEYRSFFIYTFFGAAIWNIILIALGYLAGENQGTIELYSKEISMGIFVSVIFIIGAYIWKHKKK